MRRNLPNEKRVRNCIDFAYIELDFAHLSDINVSVPEFDFLTEINDSSCFYLKSIIFRFSAFFLNSWYIIYYLIIKIITVKHHDLLTRIAFSTCCFQYLLPVLFNVLNIVSRKLLFIQRKKVPPWLFALTELYCIIIMLIKLEDFLPHLFLSCSFTS